MNTIYSLYSLVRPLLIKIKNRLSTFLKFDCDPYLILIFFLQKKIKDFSIKNLYRFLVKNEDNNKKPETNNNYEIHCFIYSSACERMIIPVIKEIANYIQQNNVSDLNIFVTTKWHNNPSLNMNLEKLGCKVRLNFYHIYRLCVEPNKSKKILILCCDHQRTYKAHKRGVDVAKILRKFGVKTVSIQHGGSDPDTLEDHASFASDFLLVWGRYSFHQLVDKYNVESSKLRVVGNPNLDQCCSTTDKEVLNLFKTIYPEHYIRSIGKLIVILAISIQKTPYSYMHQVEHEKYIRCLYDSIDFSQVYLIIKMHPADGNELNLYKKLLNSKNKNSILIIEPSEQTITTYSLLKISNLVITLASTVAEEALLLRVPVLAFDLYPTGPSNAYSFLQKYPLYERFVWASNHKDLNDKILHLASAHKYNQLENDKIDSQMEEDLTYKLDGYSSLRAAKSVMSIIDYPE